MKKNLFLLLLTIFASLIVNAQITIGNGNIFGSAPFTGSYSYSYSQSIYLKGSIGASGSITGLRYKSSSSTAMFNNTNKVQVWMGHTSKNVFSNNTDYLPTSVMTKVFDGILTFSAGVTTINFSDSFTYNNVDNLVIAVNEIAPNYGSSSDKFSSTSAPALSTIQAYYLFGGSVIDPTNIAAGTSKASYSYLPNVTLLGLTAPAVAPQCTTVTSPANGATNVEFLPKIDYNSSAGATKYFVTVGTTPGGNDITNHYDNGSYLDYFFAEGLDPETTYYVTINPSNSNGEAMGCSTSSFTTGPAVANDNCSTAEAITALPFIKAVDATYSSNNGGYVSCDGIEVANDGVWYSFLGTGEKIEVKVKATEFWDPMIVVKESTCAATSCVVSVDETGYQGTETGTFVSQAGIMYYINVGNRSLIDFAEGEFDLSVKSLGYLSADELNGNLNSISINPNPVQDQLNINGNLSSFTGYQIYSINGQMVQQDNLKQQKTIFVGKLAAGIYLFKLNGSSNSKTVKFIKK